MSIFDQAITCSDKIITKFYASGKLGDRYINETQGVKDLVFYSDVYRRAHVSIVDARETKKLWLLHATVFPHTNNPAPIYGFDIIAGPSRVSGAFHDFSPISHSHPLCNWFEEQTKDLGWNKRRELPDWAKPIFSNNMVAIGSVGELELDCFIQLGLDNLDHYLKNMSIPFWNSGDFSSQQNFYCQQQRLNLHTPRVLVNLGFTEEEASNFVRKHLFPEVV